jgi:hypothetical protein
MDHIGINQTILLVQQYDDFPFIALIEQYHGFSKSKSSYNAFTSYATSTTFKWVVWDNYSSSQEGFEGFIKVELSLFHKFHVENANGLDPSKWWGCNQSKFPNVGFLAQQFLGILSSQIKTIRISLVAPMYSLAYDNVVLGLKILTSL